VDLNAILDSMKREVHDCVTVYDSDRMVRHFFVILEKKEPYDEAARPAPLGVPSPDISELLLAERVARKIGHVTSLLPKVAGVENRVHYLASFPRHPVTEKVDRKALLAAQRGGDKKSAAAAGFLENKKRGAAFSGGFSELPGGELLRGCFRLMLRALGAWYFCRRPALVRTLLAKEELFPKETRNDLRFFRYVQETALEAAIVLYKRAFVLRITYPKFDEAISSFREKAVKHLGSREGISQILVG
jgi:hypothetical protein